MTQSLFSSLPLPGPLLENMISLGFIRMTPIQEESLPMALQGRDLIAKAKTGSGKTVAFAITMLTKVQGRDFGCQGLVLCPTRELATQVATEIRKLARYKQNIKVVVLCGGHPIGLQISSLAHGGHIIVGTPGRVLDHLRKETLVLHKVDTVVLDEADRMLDMGFIDSIHSIIGHTSKARQTLLFSATYPKAIKELSKAIQDDPQEVTVESTHHVNHIQQLFYLADKSGKSTILLKLLNSYQPTSVVIFCNTQKTCKEVNTILCDQDYKSLMLHGGLEQKERDQALVRFANHSVTLLVATDVAARGLDIENLEMVINYDLSRDAKVHIHRIGRTGRAGKKGKAINLYTEGEQYKLDNISDYLRSELSFADHRQIKESNRPLSGAPMVTLCIDGGKKHKIRPGDILGALTSNADIPSDKIGKIDIFDFISYVAIYKSYGEKALEKLSKERIKGKKFKIRSL